MIFEDLIDIQILGQIPDNCNNLFTRESVIFTSELERSFRIQRQKLLDLRLNNKNEEAEGQTSGFLESTKAIREEEWTINNPLSPQEISSFKIINSDNLSWQEIINSLSHVSKNEKIGLFKPRNLELNEENFLVDNQQISACIFDFGFYYFNNQDNAYICLSGIENHYEARFWNDVFLSAENTVNKSPKGAPVSIYSRAEPWTQTEFGNPESETRGILKTNKETNQIKPCLYIDSLDTLFQLEEILYELKDNVFAVSIDKDFYEYNDDFLLEMSNNNNLDISEYIKSVAEKRNLIIL